MSVNGIGALERGYRRSPQRETLALLAQALDLDQEQRAAFAATAASSAAPRGHGVAAPATLPIAVRSFVGRDAELREIDALIREHRLVTLTGTGGIGKTQTALRAAAALGGPTPIYFVGLAPFGADSVVAAVASAVGAQETPVRPLLESLIGHLKNKTLLLILDNCEHVVERAAAVTDALLQSCPRVRVLATSREPLRTGGEHTYRLPSLSEQGAVELFADRARAVDHRFAVTDENARLVAELCRRLDGIPLAIELAAARVNTLPVRSLVERLDERFRILSGGERTALPRHQTMHATIDWSYNLLDDRERLVFARLAVFPGGFTLEGAEAVVCDPSLERTDVFEILSSLAEKSLVVSDVDRAEPRFRLLESTRAFAAEKLAENGEGFVLARRHAQWAAGLAERARRSAATTPVEPWVRTFEPELQSARAAIDWALASDDAPLAARIAAGFAGVWRMNHGFAEPRRWLEAALPHLDGGETELTARAWYALSTVTFGMRKAEAARRALEFDSNLGDAGDRVATLYQVSQGLLEAGRVEEAQAANDRALRLCRENGSMHSRRYAAALEMRARVAARGDRLDEARQYYAEALSLTSALGDEHEAILIRTNVAELDSRAGDFARALESAEAAVEAARRVRSHHREITALANASAYRILLGDSKGARESAREALELARGTQPRDAAIALQHLATVAAHDGDARRAARLRGYVDAWYRNEECERELTERRTYEMLTEALRERLSDAEIAKLVREGEQLSEERAVAEALAV